MSRQQFKNFTASSLYCEKCKAAMPVRERLLLVLPDKEIFDYLCTGEIGVPTLQALQKSTEHELVAVVTQPDKPVGREQRIEPPLIKKALAGTTMSILQPLKIKDRQSIERIRALRPDVIVVVAYGQILPRDVL